MTLKSEPNHLNQPVGLSVPNWNPVSPPSTETMIGKYCRVELLDPDKHARALFAANRHDMDGRNWTYLFAEPFVDTDEYKFWLCEMTKSTDPLFFAIIDTGTGLPVGIAAYLRIDPKNGVIEVGHINFSPLLQRKAAATEAMYLMMKRVFDQGYRRYEWKCNALNAASRKAAQRFGFSYEGTVRQAVVVKGRNRDTGWYSVLDDEWPPLQKAFEKWLDPTNFDADDVQKVSLSLLTEPLLKSKG